MPQQTNLNVAPYFDDFDAGKDYHKVLFKPSYPVQARELTTLQTILQNQIEKFGQHFFKEGAKVIPGNTAYNRLYNCVELQNTYLGVPVSAYADQLVGAKITGKTSGITAIIDYVLFPQDSERNNLTLYLSYINTSTTDNSSVTFFDGEELTANISINSTLLSNSVLSPGETFAATIPQNCASVGSSFSISEGIYFIRGYFVNVNSETLILDQYSNSPNYRVGLYIEENIINADIDESLNDNSQGFNNYSAPGADRLQISTFLYKKSLTDFDDNNFIELGTIADGVLRADSSTNTNYNLIRDELARRTYAESGDYVVSPFDLDINESLNNKKGNNGIFDKNQFTFGGATPTDDLIVYKLSPGKAFVRGYQIETISQTFLDVPKPRTTKTLENQSIPYNTGSTLKLNRVYGNPQVGFGNTYYVSLRDSRVATSQISEPGKEIGVARVYDFKLASSSYDQTYKNRNEWAISLYDVQTFTEITLNKSTTLNVPTYIKGTRSGATGFLRSSVSSGIGVTLYNVSGSFIKNESYIINGIESGLVGLAVTSYGITDVRSIFGRVGTSSTFSGDTVNILVNDSLNFGVSSVTSPSSGISTIYFSEYDSAINFKRLNPKVGDILTYNAFNNTNSNSGDTKAVKIVKIDGSQVSITGLTTVPGIINGALPSSSELYDFYLLRPSLQSSTDDTLYTKLPKNNISNVDISKSKLTIRKSFSVNVSGGKLSSALSSGNNESFLPYTTERYSLVKQDGTFINLSADKFQILSGGSQLQINNLDSGTYSATLIATLEKINPTSKVKRKNRVESIIINNSSNEGSGIGNTTLNDGLVYGNYPFGTRVQDELISLNTSDIIEVHGIFESADTSNPSCPTAVLTSIVGQFSNTSDLIIGEEIVGSNSGSIAIVAEILDNSKISFLYKNDFTFVEGENITFSESNTTARILTLTAINSNITKNYVANDGQNSSFYDFGYIKRSPNLLAPSRKIKIYFSTAYYDVEDDGDLTTNNSYLNFDYSREIRSVDGNSVTDILDIRPTVSDYSVLEGKRSPLEFFGRDFNSTINNTISILASNESILTSFSYYLGRIDRVYLSKDGKFIVSYGSPSDNPSPAVTIDDAIEIATVNLPPYLHSTSQATLKPVEHKRYRMSDIKNLEDRIKNLEYYTTLSLLETNTANMIIEDDRGLNRFKSGFFVDNFTSTISQQFVGYGKNSIDSSQQHLRPSHHTTNLSLKLDTGSGSSFISGGVGVYPKGNNVRLNGDIITLDYREVMWLEQKYATRSESVTPFLISFWQGTLELTPASDDWVDTTRLEAKVFETEGNYEKAMADAVKNLNVDPNTGFAPQVWGSWINNWTGSTTKKETQQRTETSGAQWRGGSGFAWIFGTQTTTTFEDTYNITYQTGTANRTGTQTIVTEQFDRVSTGDRVLNRNLVANMRSRNVQFDAKKIKPLSQIYAFFDGTNVTKYCVPKLLEIEMLTGSVPFQVGENVRGSKLKLGLLGSGQSAADSKIRFIASQPNHKEGPINSPTELYGENPYKPGQTLPSTYSSTSSILNVDTYSLSDYSEGKYGGWVEAGMYLYGESSKAEARIVSVRLLSDISANLMGSFWIPNSSVASHPKFTTGKKVFTLLNDPNNNQNAASTIAEESFTASGVLETVQEQIISIRNARVENKQVFDQRAIERAGSAQLVSSTIVNQTSQQVLVGWYDPLAQSFLVDNQEGVFITRCDVFFKSKDDSNIPVTFQIRSMEGGYPTQYVLPFSEVVFSPGKINISSDGSVATSFSFKSPVFLEGGKEYAIALASQSTKYSVFISRIGENDLLTQTFISNQPYLGSLFKSQNASTWEASQWEDLKFVLYRADFAQTGSIDLYDPQLNFYSGHIIQLPNSNLLSYSKKIRVSLASTINDSQLKIGNTILQQGTNGRGNYVGSGGSAFGSMTISNAGIGYTPDSGISTFNNISLVTISGKGTGATAEITVSNGGISSARVINGGFGYLSGDVVGISTIGDFLTGRDARITVSSISNVNQIIIDGVQGEFEVGVGKTLLYVNSLGITTNLNSALGGNVLVDNIIEESDGLHMKVLMSNHGMYSKNNIVQLSEVYPDSVPTKLTAEYPINSTAPISIQDSQNFSTFEGVGVGTTNPGYLRINSEIIKYTSVTGNTLGGIERSILGSQQGRHTSGSTVWKYEFNGISLIRINKKHKFSDVTVGDPIGIDYFNIKIDTSDNSTQYVADRSANSGFGKLYQKETKNAYGEGYNFGFSCTKNIQYQIITPNIHNVTVTGTSIDSEIRTITGTSVSGNEVSFIDNGYERITLNNINYLNTTRLIASVPNAENLIISGLNSLHLKMNLQSTTSYLSPVLDRSRMSVILTSNSINNAITNYATDSKVNSLTDDPSAFQYVTKEIVLENPATSIKVMLSGYLTSVCDIRALYSIGDNQGFLPIFTPFPGYDNLDENSKIISFENSNGKSDSLVTPSSNLVFYPKASDFKEYTFTVDNLPSFRNFRIKLVGSSTDQVQVPIIRDLRVIALA